MTPTHDRPVAFALCERYMARQTYDGPVRWIVVDDGTESVECHHGQEHIRLPSIESPRESFRANWRAGLGEVDPTGITLFIEDDDWYSPEYIDRMVELLAEATIAGESRARFYNVRRRMWLVHPNRSHASLCQTGIRGEEMHDRVLHILKHDRRIESLDGRLWKRASVPERAKLLRPASTMLVGIKGMPGRSGLGVGHASETQLASEGYAKDPSLDKLREWVGDDASNYAAFFSPEST
ncbi:MAG: glycosyltransferase family 2 protein [Planctomycetaceae bacterium]|nr:glycosyltransferase family 2 protein [Planctomycetaceae bacterium]